jgi:sec-independent protein translocase protein TatC
MALPMYIFYEVGIISAGFFNKKLAPTAGPAGPLAPVGAKIMAPAMSGAGDSEYLGVPTGTGRRR